jgi:hypothetical protein
MQAIDAAGCHPVALEVCRIQTGANPKHGDGYGPQ